MRQNSHYGALPSARSAAAGPGQPARLPGDAWPGEGKERARFSEAQPRSLLPTCAERGAGSPSAAPAPLVELIFVL